jgi:hypothetical protein
MTWQIPSVTTAPTQALYQDEAQGVAAGTAVLTLDGELPVEYLSPGDRIVTRNAGAQTLRALDWADVPSDQVVAVNPGALGRANASGPALIAADQAVLLRDWLSRALHGKSSVLTPVRCLIDGAGIRPLAAGSSVRLYRLILDAVHVIYAGGLELGTAPARRLAEVA